MFSKLKNIDLILNKIGVIIASIALASILLFNFLDIVLSYLFKLPIPGVLEGTELFLIIVIFLGFSYQQQTHGNIQMDLIVSKLSEKKQKVFDFISYLIMSAFYLLFSIQSWVGAIHSCKVLEYRSGAVSFPVYPIKIILAVGMTILFLFNLRKIIKILKNKQEERKS